MKNNFSSNGSRFWAWFIGCGEEKAYTMDYYITIKNDGLDLYL